MEAYICRGWLTEDLNYDWLMIMPLGGGAVVSFDHFDDFIVFKVKSSVRALDLNWISTSNR